MTTRNRYVKVALTDECPTNLMGATVVGQYGTTLLVERAQPKTRTAATARKPKKPAAASAPVTQPPATEANRGA